MENPSTSETNITLFKMLMGVVKTLVDKKVITIEEVTKNLTEGNELAGFAGDFTAKFSYDNIKAEANKIRKEK